MLNHSLTCQAENIYAESVLTPAADQQEQFGDEIRLHSKQTKNEKTATNSPFPPKKSAPKWQCGSCLTSKTSRLCCMSGSSYLGTVRGADGEGAQGPLGAGDVDLLCTHVLKFIKPYAYN